MRYIAKFLQDNNFKVDGRVAYGIYKQRVMCINELLSHVKVNITFNAQLSQEQGQAISNKIREIKLSNKILQQGITTNLYLELIFYRSYDFYNEFMTVLDKCLEVLDDFQLPTCEICTFCGKVLSTTDPFIKIKDNVVQGHEACISQLISTTENLEKQMTSSSKKGWLKTLAVAFISMLVATGIIVLISFAGIFDYVSFLAGTLALTFMKISYMKFKILYGKLQIILSGVFALIAILLSIYFGSIINASKVIDEFNISGAMSNYYKLFTTYYDTVGKSIVLNLVVASVFLLIVIVFDLKRYFDNKNQIKRLK